METKTETKQEQPSLKLGTNLPIKKIAMYSAIIMGLGIISTFIGVSLTGHGEFETLNRELEQVSVQLQAEKLLDVQQDKVIESKLAENKETEARIDGLSTEKNDLFKRINDLINAPSQALNEAEEVF